MADFMTDEEIEACLRSLAEFMGTLPAKDAQLIQRGIKAVEQVAHSMRESDKSPSVLVRAESQVSQWPANGTRLPLALALSAAGSGPLRRNARARACS
jgi:hypothetical protein